MLVLLFWCMLFFLGTNYFFSETLALIPNLMLVNISQCLVRIFGTLAILFVIWSFAEDKP